MTTVIINCLLLILSLICGCRPEGSDFYNSVEASTEVPQPITHSGGLAGRRGSRDLELHLKMPQCMNVVSDTNPRSSDPLLGKKFFTNSDEVDPSSFGLGDTVENNGVMERYGSSNGVPVHTSVEINEKVDLSFETSGHNVSEHPV